MASKRSWPRRQDASSSLSTKSPVKQKEGLSTLSRPSAPSWLSAANKRIAQLKKQKKLQGRKKFSYEKKIEQEKKERERRKNQPQTCLKNQYTEETLPEICSTPKISAPTNKLSRQEQNMPKHSTLVEDKENASKNEKSNAMESGWNFEDEPKEASVPKKPLKRMAAVLDEVSKNEYREVSTNFVKLRMGKRLRGRSGKPRKLPEYMRSRSSTTFEATERKQNKSTSAGGIGSGKTGVDVITEYIQVVEKQQKDEKMPPVKELPPPKCSQHGFPAQLLTVKKAGPNKGKEFYACSLGFNEGRCDFFLWADDNVDSALRASRGVSGPEKKLADPELMEQVATLVQKIHVNSPSKQHLLELLQIVFNHANFREGQLWAIERTLQGKKSLVVLPTGAGKSICYQLPSLITPGLTLVVSPLVSLMTDQMMNLPNSLVAATLSGQHQSAKQLMEIIRSLRKNEIDVLFLSPERLVSRSFQRLFTAGMLPRISFACIDEAHCLSEWSHNFRPAYLRVSHALQHVYNVDAILALTATASLPVQQDICQMLDIHPSGVFKSNWYRPNLKLCVMETPSDDDRYAEILKLLSAPPFSTGSMIIYVHQKYHAENLASILQQHKFKARAYHSGVDLSERQDIQKKFLKGSVRIAVATISFGMGIDKRNVRSIIHFYMPSSLEHYVQEIGRAGRDNRRAFCLLLLVPQDYIKFHSLAHSNGIQMETAQRFLRIIFPKKDTSTDESAVTRISMGENGSYPMELTISQRQAEKILDVKGEVFETMLAAIEQCHKELQHEPEQIVEVKSSLCATCKLHIRSTAVSKLQNEDLYQYLQDETICSREDYAEGYIEGTNYTFNLLQMSWSLFKQENQEALVVQTLRRWQYAGTATYEMEDYSFRILLRRKPHDPDAISQHLHEKACHLERKAVTKCRTVYDTLQQAQVSSTDAHKYFASFSSRKHSAEGEFPSIVQAVETKIDELVDRISDYFELAPPKASEVAESIENSEQITSFLGPLPEETKQSIFRDTTELLKDERSLCNMEWVTSRSVTRIFHGIGSPRFPRDEWCESQYWGKLTHVRFEAVLAAVAEALEEQQVKALT